MPLVIDVGHRIAHGLRKELGEGVKAAGFFEARGAFVGISRLVQVVRVLCEGKVLLFEARQRETG